ncbi:MULTISPECIES: ABC transporter six-transmembrane domain-containing protein [Rodentibacter]|uniref:ABC transporter six-transmembrane domain-containing protein n=1 Tax=Rodentibacter TaxID=1960084 RepID=UPI001CFCDE81|nr:ABC transporter six-transmembrane domain-containing protein [Rodentibacter sp. JRC1]GJI55458.1 membrane protein [Rodentibacter sp. JRC1]
MRANALENLKSIAKNNKRRLFITFFFVALENILFLTYPIFGSFAVNAIMQGEIWLSLTYSLVVLIIWLVGATRRAIDTRAFARIYAELAVPIVLNQREKNLNTSAITARVALSRQFVDFFEQHLPTLIMSGFSIIGAAVMLLIIEFWSGVTAFGILIFFSFLLPQYAKINDLLYLKLNNRLEKEVQVIEKSESYQLDKHYDLLAKLRIRLSNREAMGYLWIGVAAAILFGVTVIRLATTDGIQAGHIYAVITYLWTFAMSLGDAPRLLEEFSNLKDIGKRVEV